VFNFSLPEEWYSTEFYQQFAFTSESLTIRKQTCDQLEWREGVNIAASNCGREKGVEGVDAEGGLQGVALTTDAFFFRE